MTSDLHQAVQIGHPDPQRQSLFFSCLPTEVRLQIYREVSPEPLHLTMRPGRRKGDQGPNWWWRYPCQKIPDASLLQARAVKHRSASFYLWGERYRSWRHGHLVCAPTWEFQSMMNHFSGPDDHALLLTCRQIYTEGLDHIGPRSLIFVRLIELAWALRSGLPARALHRATDVSLSFELLDYQVMEVWPTYCTGLASLPRLKNLNVTFLVPRNFSLCTQLIEPLKRIRGCNVTVDIVDESKSQDFEEVSIDSDSRLVIRNRGNEGLFMRALRREL
ncbi:hypothetical protein F5Y15DRAFT_6249 [Xylariaceae sp. FL0016]|nr:hypothetical protein F5Y15DRAFT_6249 [Xylariaceae sp. FL0016]